ncbi:MAG: aminopeptidase, partial [Desulfobacterales bacterium]|nr:aminopeptidase [Desulfobacterales bacterium]
MHGRVIKRDGSAVDIVIGESEEDAAFTIADLLPHLARKIQGNKKLGEAFEAEKMNLLVGSMPTGDDKIKERFKLTAMKYLHEKYGLIEEDLVSAELEVVPAGRARDVGLDRSLIGAYGHDDRICAYTTMEAILDLGRPERTAIALMMDKEEIGSEGSTGSKSRFMEEFVSDLQAKIKSDTSERAMRKVLMGSAALSADVNAGLNPNYQEVHEKRNAARIGYGICLTKFTGSGGKSGSNDASAEYVGKIRKLFNDKSVPWQTGELGKVDEGGGGTIAKFMAAYGMDTLDAGPAVLSMHSPFEIASKADVYMSYKAYHAFFTSYE